MCSFSGPESPRKDEGDVTEGGKPPPTANADGAEGEGKEGGKGANKPSVAVAWGLEEVGALVCTFGASQCDTIHMVRQCAQF